MSARSYSVLFTGLVFACGVITGLLGDHLWEGHSVRAVSINQESRPHVIEAVRRELSLTEQQTKEVDGYSVEELAGMHKMNENTVKVKLFRARQKLMKASRKNPSLRPGFAESE